MKELKSIIYNLPWKILLNIFSIGFCAYVFSNPIEYSCCSHNGREGVSAADVLEHILNQDFGDVFRDLLDLCEGEEEFAGINQKSNENHENSEKMWY